MATKDKLPRDKQPQIGRVILGFLGKPAIEPGALIAQVSRLGR